MHFQSGIKSSFLLGWFLIFSFRSLVNGNCLGHFFFLIFFLYSILKNTQKIVSISICFQKECIHSIYLFAYYLISSHKSIKFSWITVLPYTFSENVETEYCFGSKYFPPYFLSLPGMHPSICSTPKTGIFEHRFQKCRNILLSKYT